MNQGDETRFSRIMFVLAEAFCQEASPFKIEIYFQGLADLQIDEIERAVWKIIRGRTTASFPKIAEIREAITGRLEDRALQAIDKIQKAIREIDGYDTVVFDDPVIHVMIQNYGGWIHLTQVVHDDPAQWTWIRKDFLSAYRVYAGQPIPESTPVRLVGIHDQSNAVNGQAYERNAVYIGDRKQALAWTQKIGLAKKQTNRAVLALAEGIGG